MSHHKPTLGLDIGGANLKAATTDGYAESVPFELWRRPQQLATALGELLDGAPAHGRLAVTMTGELADCYETKAQGVSAIVHAVEAAAPGAPAWFYTLRGEFVPADRAIVGWSLVAAANWHALARSLASLAPGPAVLIDVGSTTTDLIPFTGDTPGGDRGAIDSALDDTGRLICGQLLYQGVGRTPVCAVVDRLPYRGKSCPVAAELFATTADIALLLGHTPPSDSTDTADGRPMNEAASVARLGRMLCADRTQFGYDDALLAARHVADRMEERLATALRRACQQARAEPERFLISGAGDWLARRALNTLGRFDSIASVAVEIGQPASVCAPAWAVATLLEQSLRP